MVDVRTWIEIDAAALRHNAEQFLRLLPSETRFMAVVKSNAYGHGLIHVAKILQPVFGDSTSKYWFGVDSITEAVRLRREGVQNPILVFGYTLPSRGAVSASRDVTLTVSSTETLKAVAALTRRPRIHLKIDTGMHRQGFLPADVPEVIRMLKRFRMQPEGIYTHFASANDPTDLRYTRKQMSLFGGVSSEMERAGFRGMIRHAAASGGTLLFPESHLDMVRVGMGLYGYWPSPEARIKDKSKKIKVDLRPVMAWKTIVGEIKNIPKGALVGYDGTERVRRPTKMAVLPVGYWHGLDSGLSGKGEVIIRGHRAKVLGRISMDMTVVDVTDILGVKTGDEAALIGRMGKAVMRADEIAAGIDTNAYDVLTRINPLIRRIIINDE